MSFTNLFSRTFPFILLRMLVSLALVFAFLIYGAISIAIVSAISNITNGGFLPAVTGFLLFFGALGIWRLIKSLVLYAVKAGHVAVLSELIAKGDLPQGVGQFTFASQKVKKFFATSGVMWALDLLINKTVKDIKSNLSSMGESLKFIPGMNYVISIFSVFIGVLLSYSDEAIFAYIFQKEGQNVWKSAADGIVIFVQNWKEMMKSAFLVTLFLIGSAGAAWLLVYGLAFFSEAMQANTGVIMVVAIGIFLFLKWGFVDPVVMIFMVNRYLSTSLNQTPAVDVYSRVQGFSKRFGEILAKAGVQAQPQVAFAATNSLSNPQVVTGQEVNRTQELNNIDVIQSIQGNVTNDNQDNQTS